MKFICLIASLCALSIPAYGQSSAPAGWRFPTDADLSGGWKEFRGTDRVPFHVRADFNGDGRHDDVWILLSTRDKRWGLFFFEVPRTGSLRVVELDVSDPDKDREVGQAQNMGVEIAPAGDHKTACGKGYWPCTKGEPMVLHLDRPGINYFQFESANSIFWWDVKSKSFKRTWISD